MFWLIETQEQIQRFQELNYKEVFTEIIPISNKVNPVINDICCIYVHPIKSDKGYIINICHDEAFKNNLTNILPIFKSFNKIYVRDKKEFLHYIQVSNVYDITLEKKYAIKYPNIYGIFYGKRIDNTIIPIVKHYECCANIYKDLKSEINKPINSFYNNQLTIVLWYIENNGLKIDKEKVAEHFHKIVDSDYMYTQYNFRTITTRPSNAWDGINFSSLKKDNNERECFIARNDFLLEIDLSTYQPFLMSKLAHYELQGDIYEQISNHMGCSRKEAKKVLLNTTYGSSLELSDLEFFQKVNIFKTNLWNKYQVEKQIVCPISKHIIKEGINTPGKLLSYYLQNIETSVNTILMKKMIKILCGRDTKLIMYTYDAFLFDVSKKDKDQIKEIIKILDKHGLKYKYKSGKNYNF